MTRETEPLSTPRLGLVPLRPSDAEEMVGVLADPGLYVFIGGQPPDLDELHDTYERRCVGQSADATEAWHNWIVRRRREGDAIGFVQATVDRARGTADVAWLIGVPWQGGGYATEAAQEMVAWLERGSVSMVTAHVHLDHRASEVVAAHAGLTPSDEIDDGERVWWRGRDPGATVRHDPR